MSARTYRAGDAVEDFCRACKTDRMHTVIAADGEGHPIRVVCGFCHSEHNFRGGPRVALTEMDRPARGGRAAPGSTSSGSTDSSAAVRPPREAFPLVSERERIGPVMTDLSGTDIEMLLRRIIREETGLSPVTPAEKWRGGILAIRPGNPELQEKTWPIETFFHKVVMLRNRLRTLEQQVNATDLPEDVKIKLQGYISGCYGSLTSFNVLFAEEADQFKGSASD
jgi:hypothetical protein